MLSNENKKLDESELQVNEYHPAATDALWWYKEWAKDFRRYAMVREALASTALAGNRLAQICNGTLDRLQKGQPVSDRYLLGLCWFLRHEMEEVLKK